MSNLLTAHLTESGYWWDGSSQHGNYSTDTPLTPSNNVLDCQIYDTMTLVNNYPGTPRDIQSSKKYMLYFTTPNDGLSRQMKYDVGIAVLTNSQSGLVEFWYDHPFTVQGHIFLNGQFGWLDAPESWSSSWTDDIYHYVSPGATISIPVPVYYGLAQPSYNAAATFHWYITVTCLNPTPPPTNVNVLQMIIEQN